MAFTCLTIEMFLWRASLDGHTFVLCIAPDITNVHDGDDDVGLKGDTRAWE